MSPSVLNGKTQFKDMPRYRFQWTNIRPDLIQELASGLKLEGDAIESLIERYGSRPKPEFIKDSLLIFLDKWLPNDLNAATQIAAALKTRGLGDIETKDSITYLKTCRNTSGFRDVVIDTFIAMGEDKSNAIQGSTELNVGEHTIRLTEAQLVAKPLVPKESEIPWAVLRNPSDLREWIGDDDDRLEKAWLDNENDVANKWLIAAIDPDHAIFISPEDLRNKIYSVDEDHWGDGAAIDIKEWVLGCFSDYTGLNGQLVPRESIDFYTDEAGRISDISGFVIFAIITDASLMTTWLANFYGFDAEGEEGWWLEFGYDEFAAMEISE